MRTLWWRHQGVWLWLDPPPFLSFFSNFWFLTSLMDFFFKFFWNKRSRLSCYFSWFEIVENSIFVCRKQHKSRMRKSRWTVGAPSPVSCLQCAGLIPLCPDPTSTALGKLPHACLCAPTHAGHTQPMTCRHAHLVVVSRSGHPSWVTSQVLLLPYFGDGAHPPPPSHPAA